MTATGDGHVLAVDLGTSHTVAMLRWPDERTRPLLFDGQPLLPSAVYLDAEGRLHVGRDAQRLGYADPARIEPNPKRHIDAEAVLLGGTEVPVAALFAALLGAVAREAVNTAGFLPPAVLTYPAAWGQGRRAVLTDALTRAGWPADTELVPEPVAAARYFADVLRRPVPVGSSLAVFDFGGGTLDVAVVRNEGPHFVVTACGGVDDLGGLDLDAAMVGHLGGDLADGEPEAWAALGDPRTLAQWRARRQFWEDVRGAKEMLSRATRAPVAVPGVEHAVALTREEFEASAGPLIRRGVAEAGEVIEAAGLSPSSLAGLFLVGGSSRVPMVARLLHAELGVAPTVLEQPELPVAEGAIAAVAQGSTAGAALSPSTSAAPAGLAASTDLADSPGLADSAGSAGSVGSAGSAGSSGLSGGSVGQPAPGSPAPTQFRPGVAEARTPTPTPATVPQQQTAPGAQPPGVGASASGSPGAFAAPGSPAPPSGYAEPVDPWATGEAAAFGPGGPPVYPGSGAPAFGGTPTGVGPTLEDTQPPHAEVPVAGNGGGGPVAGNGGGGSAAGKRGGGPVAGTGGGIPVAGTGGGGPVAGTGAGGPVAGKGDGRSYPRKLILILAAGLVVVLAAAGTAVWYLWPGFRALDYQPLAKSAPAVLAPAVPLTGSGFAQVKVNGKRAYFANEGADKTLGVVAADTSSGERLWSSVEAGSYPPGWERIVATADAVVASGKENYDTKTRRLFVLDAGDGRTRWHQDVDADDTVLAFDDVAVWSDKKSQRLVGLRMSDGTEKWSVGDVKTDSGTTTGVIVASTDAGVAGPAQMDGVPLDRGDDDARLLQVMADRSARVIDRETGKVLVAAKGGIAAPDTPVMVHEGRVVVIEKANNAQRVLTYDLDDLSGPSVIGSISPDATADNVTPCGAGHACWIEKTSYDAKTSQVAGVAVDDGAAPIWRVALPGADHLVPVGENVLVNRADAPGAKVTLVSSTGKQQWTVDGQAARLDGGNVLRFSKPLTDSLDDPSLEGVHLGDDPELLGPLAGVHTSSCSWNTEAVACVAEKDFRLHKFVG